MATGRCSAHRGVRDRHGAGVHGEGNELRARARAVRAPDRLVPGRQAHARRHGGASGGGARRGAQRRGHARRPDDRRRRPRGRGRQAPGRRGRVAQCQDLAPGARRHGLHVGGRRPLVREAGLGARHRLRVRRRPRRRRGRDTLGGRMTEERPEGAERPEDAAERSNTPTGIPRPAASEAIKWKPLLDDLDARREAARAMGGSERLARQRAGGRLDARARIDELLDRGTFVELGTLVGSVQRGAAVHTVTSGVAHNAATDDKAALALVRRYLSYFPSNAWEHPPPARDHAATGPRRLDELIDLVPADPRRGYDVRRVIEIVFDEASVLEVAPAHARAVVTTLARLGGEVVAVVANQPATKAGSIDSAAADKAAHFLGIADAFHLPVVFMADNPGVLAGSAAERSGILRHAARMFAAQARVRSPKLHVTLRKAYGFGSSLMAMNPFDGQSVTLALPGARLGAMPAEGGGQAARLEADAQALLEHAELGGAYSSADTMGYDEVIAPAELRNALLDALRLTAVRRRQPVEPARHRGILP